MTTLQREDRNDERDTQHDDGDTGTGGGERTDGGDDDDRRSGDDDEAEIEARARRMGWLPEEEWDDERAEKQGRVKPRKFISPREYIENAENSLPMLRAQLRNTDAKLAEVTRQNTEIYEVLQEQSRLHKANIERVRKEERERLMKERDDAFDAGDKAAFKEAEAKLEELDATPATPKPDGGTEKPGKVDPPEIVEFKAQNPWFTTDTSLTNNMIDEYGAVKAKYPNLSFREQLAEARRMLAKRYPEKFGINSRREAARGAITPPGGRDDNSVEVRFARLSADEKAAFERNLRMVKSRGGTLTKAEWMKEIGR